tara:strand:+ start:12710 stop:13513 length:804 start_codon:yes stop_codon:yes gene_type:complete
LGIETYVGDLLEEAWNRGFSKSGLARAAGVDVSSFAAVEAGKRPGIGRGGFNATLETVRALEKALGKEDDANALMPFEWRGAILGRDESRGVQHSKRVLLDRSIVPLFAAELTAIERYCTGLRREHRGLFAEDLNTDVLRYLGPNVRVHFASAPKKETDAIWLHWDSNAEILGGEDIAGKPVSYAGDDRFAEEIHQDIKIARDAGIPLFHAIYRQGVINDCDGPLTRFYFRLLQRLQRRDGGFEILWATVRKNHETARYFFPNLVSG